MEKTIKIPVSKLTTMHTVRIEDGSFQKITSIDNGMANGTLLIHYANGKWGNIPRKDMAEVKRTIYGRIPNLASWVVGPTTDFGTVSRKDDVAEFDTPEEAEALSKKLNNEE